MSADRPVRIVIVGDVVLDRDVDGVSHRLCPDSPAPIVDVTATRQGPGGAGLAALLARRHARVGEVVLVAPLATDEEGGQVHAALADAGVEIVALRHEGSTRCTTRVRSDGVPLVRVDDGGPGRPLDVDPEAVRAALAGADVVLVVDDGAGTTTDPAVRAALERAARAVPMLWDPDPRGGAPVPGVALATPDEAEARTALLGSADTPEALAAELHWAWKAGAVAVTCGADGVFLADETSQWVPGEPVPNPPDACGAGDAFAVGAAVALAGGATAVDAVHSATRDATAWVVAGGVSAFRDPAGAPGPAGRGASEASEAGHAARVADRVHAVGGTLVAVRGAVDPLDADHLATLEAARRLGDALIVLLHPDAPVHEGDAGPIGPAAARARLLSALACVDAVEIVGDDPDGAALDRLRPQVWVGVGDDATDPAEAEHLARWGARVVAVSPANAATDIPTPTEPRSPNGADPTGSAPARRAPAPFPGGSDGEQPARP